MIAINKDSLASVKPESRWLVRALENRLLAFEQGYFHGYANHLEAIRYHACGILEDKDSRENAINEIKKSHDYLDAVYSEIDFSKLPRNKDTIHYFRSRLIYSVLEQEIRKLKEASTLNYRDFTKRLKNIDYLGSLLLTIGRKSRFEIESNVLGSLNSIPGYPLRKLKRRVPKKFKTRKLISLAMA